MPSENLSPGDFARTTEGSGSAPTLWKFDEHISDDEAGELSEEDLMLVISTGGDEFYAFVLVNGTLGYVATSWIEKAF